MLAIKVFSAVLAIVYVVYSNAGYSQELKNASAPRGCLSIGHDMTSWKSCKITVEDAFKVAVYEAIGFKVYKSEWRQNMIPSMARDRATARAWMLSKLLVKDIFSAWKLAADPLERQFAEKVLATAIEKFGEDSLIVEELVSLLMKEPSYITIYAKDPLKFIKFLRRIGMSVGVSELSNGKEIIRFAPLAEPTALGGLPGILAGVGWTIGETVANPIFQLVNKPVFQSLKELGHHKELEGSYLWQQAHIDPLEDTARVNRQRIQQKMSEQGLYNPQIQAKGEK